MLKQSLLSNEKGKRVILSGNEAIVRGAIEADVKFATSYPGNPCTEVLDTLLLVSKELGIYAEWSINEMVALEAASAGINRRPQVSCCNEACRAELGP
jgi:indolepyruvate ferredoxin oxidoreductase alpha subunit